MAYQHPMSPWIALVGLVSALRVDTGASNSATRPSHICPADAKLANLVAGSDLVLAGRMDVPRSRLVEETKKPSPDYVDIPIQISAVLKGENVGSATVRFFPRDADYKPSNDSVLSIGGVPAILFLTRVDDGPVGLYFAGYSPSALRPVSEQTIDAVQVEASRQAKIIRSWRVDTALPRFRDVQTLIAHLGRVSGSQQQYVFDQLIALGGEAVPAIISQMDDRRPLRTQAISLVNHSPDAFEGVRHYGPELVVDGLDAVLNQITGESFGSIVNGGSDRQRIAAIAGWRVYAADSVCGRKR